MASFKILTIFMVLFVVQNALAKPVDSSETLLSSAEEAEFRKNPTASQKLLLYTFDTFVSLGKHFSERAVNVSRSILKDEAFLANDKPEVLEFKKNLTHFVEKYESNKNERDLWDIVDIYTDTIDKYADLPKDKITPESKFIEEIVKKYDAHLVTLEFAVDFVSFMVNFDKKFEENKEHLDKPILDWYEKYSAITEFDEKLDAFDGFFDLVD